MRDQERTDAMVVEVPCDVVTYHSCSETKEYLAGTDRNIPDVQAPTTTTFFPS
jgi:hypothetical protein